MCPPHFTLACLIPLVLPSFRPTRWYCTTFPCIDQALPRIWLIISNGHRHLRGDLYVDSWNQSISMPSTFCDTFHFPTICWFLHLPTYVHANPKDKVNFVLADILENVLVLLVSLAPQDPLLEQVRGGLDNINSQFHKKNKFPWWGHVFSFPPKWSASFQGN
jgi:hypothetical protein